MARVGLDCAGPKPGAARNRAGAAVGQCGRTGGQWADYRWHRSRGRRAHAPALVIASSGWTPEWRGGGVGGRYRLDSYCCGVAAANGRTVELRYLLADRRLLVAPDGPFRRRRPYAGAG